MVENEKISIFWFRRDLRLKDNHGLFESLNSGKKVLAIFIFDEDILSKLPNKQDKRLDFIFHALETINGYLGNKTSGIQYFYGKPLEVFKEISLEYSIEKVFTNEDYEPYAIKRDLEIKDFLKTKNIDFESYKDQVIFAKNDILKADQSPYTIYTPFSKKWLEKFNEEGIRQYPSEKLLENLIVKKTKNFTLTKIGFENSNFQFQPPKIDWENLKNYEKNRNFPFVSGTSAISTHLRFGTVSVRELVKKAKMYSFVFLKELIWREFFMQILFHFPKVVSQSFKQKYDDITWKNDEKNFKIWCEGKTGFPLVDAGMRELNETGIMHNRVRMVVSSFLVKDLLIDWRWGEAYFAEKLLDYDLSANNGNWQWCAGSGCDAAPYFRIFNPEEQQKKFDPDFIYCKKWIAELETENYPKPMVNHKEARLKTLEAYKKAVQK